LLQADPGQKTSKQINKNKTKQKDKNNPRLYLKNYQTKKDWGQGTASV
jgi:hypothetical protein